MRAFTYFLNLAKSSLIFLKFTFKLLEINLKAHYFIKKKKKSSHDNFLIASRINLKALCVLTSMIKKRMKRKVIFIEETKKNNNKIPDDKNMLMIVILINNLVLCKWAADTHRHINYTLLHTPFLF